MFRDSVALKKDRPYTELVHIPVFLELAQQLEIRVPLRVLDLGRAQPGSVSFFNQYKCRYRVADSLKMLSELKRYPDESESGFVTRARRLMQQTFRIPEDEKLDLILCWDGLNYIDREVLILLSDFLSGHCHTETSMHCLVYGHRSIPIFGGVFDLLSDEHAMVRYPDSEFQTGPAYSQTDLEHLLSQFKVRKTLLLSCGIQEYSFQPADM